MSLWTAEEAAAATGGRAQGDWAATGVSIDTRTIRPGDLFVALKDVRDGHDFVAQALDKGAAAALVLAALLTPLLAWLAPLGFAPLAALTGLIAIAGLSVGFLMLQATPDQLAQGAAQVGEHQDRLAVLQFLQTGGHRRGIGHRQIGQARDEQERGAHHAEPPEHLQLRIPGA